MTVHVVEFIEPHPVFEKTKERRLRTFERIASRRALR